MRRLLAGVLLGLFVVVQATATQAATYYVDYVAGSNSNPGTQAAPWKTPPGASCVGLNPICANADTGDANWTNKVFASGDSILLKAGTTIPMIWYVNANHFPTNPANPIILGRYGTGEDPIIEGGQGINASEWTSLGNNVYAYAFPVSRLWMPENDRPHIYRNGIRWAKNGTIDNPSKSTARVCSDLTAQGEMLYDAANNRICVYSTAAPTSDPNGMWLVGFRRFGIHIEGVANVTVQHLRLQHKDAIVGSYGGEIEVRHASNVTIDGVSVFQSGGSGIRAFQDTYNVTGFTLKNSTILESWAYGTEVANHDNSVPGNFLQEGNTVKYSGDHGITCNAVDGCIISKNVLDSNPIGNANCGVGYCGPFAQARGKSICVTGVTATTRPKNITIKNNIAANSGPGSGYGGGDEGGAVYVYQCEGACNVFGNLTYNSTGPGLTIQYDVAPVSMPTWKVIGNTFADDGGAGVLFYNAGIGGVQNWLTMRNNQFVSARTDKTRWGQPGQPPSGYHWAAVFWQNTYSTVQQWDHNNVLNITDPTSTYFCGVYPPQATPCGSWADTTVDPKFVSHPTRDYHLQASSPLINTGTLACPDASMDLDGVSRPQGSACDMGAYEYTTSGDLDGNSVVDILDLQRMVNVLLGMEADAQVIARADLDGDGATTILDLQRLVNILLGV
jgi:hypothetical protein